MLRASGIDRQELLDSAVNAVPLVIITLLTLLFVAHNPWGWQELLLIVEVFGLHLVPILTLAPVTYLLVKVVNESSEGRSETAARIQSLLEPVGGSDGAGGAGGDDEDAGRPGGEPTGADAKGDTEAADSRQ